MCTRTLWKTVPATVVSRTLDFSEPANPRLWWLPAGLDRSGGNTPQAVRWVAQHASLSITELGNNVVEGMNSQGLAAHLLMYTAAQYEPVDDRPVLAASMWCQYVLDQCATVAQALELLAGVRVAPVDLHGYPVGAHLALCDQSGDSAICEPIAGEMVVHHGPQYPIMTNAPSMAEQLANLTRYRPFGGELPPPGDITSLDRFVRASYFRHYLPQPPDARAALADVIHIASNAAKPEGAPYPSGEVYPTRWITAMDLTNLDYYFWSRTSPNLVWVSWPDVAGVGDPSCVQVASTSLAGDVSGLMARVDLPLPPVELELQRTARPIA